MRERIEWELRSLPDDGFRGSSSWPVGTVPKRGAESWGLAVRVCLSVQNRMMLLSVWDTDGRVLSSLLKGGGVILRKEAFVRGRNDTLLYICIYIHSPEGFSTQ